MSDKTVSIQNESLTPSPLVSVLLPVFNCESYIETSINSILTQSYHHFELIVINDGSNDKSADIISQFKDSRIRFYNQPNRGLAVTLNRAIGLARGEYLARQDADDISFPQRLEKQVAFLENHPDYGVVGTWSEIWEGNKKTIRFHKHPSDNAILKFKMLFDTHFVHSSVMLRKGVIDKVGIYTTSKERQPEDYELWSRIVRDENYKLFNIPEILISYRELPTSICRTGVNPFLESVINLSVENLAWASRSPVTNPVLTDIVALAHGALHKLSLNPDFRGILCVLQNSAKRVNGLSEPMNTLLMKQVQIFYRIIRNRYRKYRYKTVIEKIKNQFSFSPWKTTGG